MSNAACYFFYFSDRGNDTVAAFLYPFYCQTQTVDTICNAFHFLF